MGAQKLGVCFSSLARYCFCAEHPGTVSIGSVDASVSVLFRLASLPFPPLYVLVCLLSRFTFSPTPDHFSPGLFCANPLCGDWEMAFSFLGEINRNITVSRHLEKCKSKISICDTVPWRIPASQLFSAGGLSELDVVSVYLVVFGYLSSMNVSFFS